MAPHRPTPRRLLHPDPPRYPYPPRQAVPSPRIRYGPSFLDRLLLVPVCVAWTLGALGLFKWFCGWGPAYFDPKHTGTGGGIVGLIGLGWVFVGIPLGIAAIYGWLMADVSTVPCPPTPPSRLPAPVTSQPTLIERAVVEEATPAGRRITTVERIHYT